MDFTDEEVSQAMELYPALWVKKYAIKNEAGVPIDFSKRKFLWDIYNDLNPKQVILKPPQIGMTVCNTLKSLWVAKKLNKQIIYTLPTQSDVQAMVGGSFNRIIAQNPLLMDWVKDHDTIEQKSVGSSIIFYRGTWTAKQAMMIPSGLNIHDEVDASNPAVITQYETRLQAQEDGGWRWYFSHPSVKGYGVDIYWEQSDKKEWFITCNHCNYEQILNWPDNISTATADYVCTRCRNTLSDTARINGEWRPTAVGEFSGYHVSQLMLWNKSAQDIIDAFNDPTKDQKYFSNYVLGLPHAESEDIITKEQILQNVSEEFNAQEDRVIIGVDTGNKLNYVLGNKQGIFNFGQTELPSANYDPYKHLEGFLLRWPRSIIVFDAQGDLIGPKQLQAKYPGRIYLCFYRPDRRSMETIQWGEKEKDGEVYVDRERMIQLMVEQMRDRRFKLNGTREEWTPYAEHFANMIRMDVSNDDEKARGIKKYRWQKNGGKPDHWAHATVYFLTGLDGFGGAPEQIGNLDWLPVQEGRMFGGLQGKDLFK